ncbi:hypothetical protein METHPM2_390004 [Pseudomonas sp. PM2]
MTSAGPSAAPMVLEPWMRRAGPWSGMGRGAATAGRAIAKHRNRTRSIMPAPSQAKGSAARLSQLDCSHMTGITRFKLWELACLRLAYRYRSIGIYTTLARRWTCGEGACSRDGLTADTYPPGAARFKCGSWLACDGGLSAYASLPDTPQSNCGSWLAREGGLAVNTVGLGTYPLLR